MIFHVSRSFEAIPRRQPILARATLRALRQQRLARLRVAMAIVLFDVAIGPDVVHGEVEDERQQNRDGFGDEGAHAQPRLESEAHHQRGDGASR